jgi:hypothetical protein
MHLGIPSIAFSQARNFRRGEPIPWECGRVWGPRVLKALLKTGWPKTCVKAFNGRLARLLHTRSPGSTRQSDRQSAPLSRAAMTRKPRGHGVFDPTLITMCPPGFRSASAF